MWEAQGETSSTHSLLRLVHENSKLMEKILSITSQGWILLLLVSLFSVGSDVLFIEGLCYNNNNSYYKS